MSDENANQTDTPPGKRDSSPDAAQNTEHMVPKSRFDEVNERMKKAEDALAQLRKQQEEAETARLTEEGKFKDLYEQAKQEAESLRQDAERAGQLLQAIADGNQRRIDQLPDEMKKLVPEYDDPAKTQAWLDANLHILTGGKPPAPSLDGGAGGGQRPDKLVTLTPQEEQLARLSGMTLEEYAKLKKEREGLYYSSPSPNKE